MSVQSGDDVAFLGATSKIAKDLIQTIAARGPSYRGLQLYVRDLQGAQQWLQRAGLSGRYPVYDYAQYGRHPHAAVVNFVGVGDPDRTAQIGEAIFGITQQFDDLVLDGLRKHPERRYIFLSSGAAYGGSFSEPAGPETAAVVPLNKIGPQDYYSVAKLCAECKHRSLKGLDITDVRVFNYFSRTQDLRARFLITDIVRAIRDGCVLQTSPDKMKRDYLHPHDFHQLIQCVLSAGPCNQVLDCYTRAPVEKQELLDVMQQRFGLRYCTRDSAGIVNATGRKPHYYSLNRDAARLGYEPSYTSLDGIILEADAMLGNSPSGK